MSNPTQETFLELSDFADIGEEFRKLWNTSRLSLNYPTATVLRYTEYPNPNTLSAITIVHSGLSITENIIGRTVSLTEGLLDIDYVVTGYTSSSITVASADFLVDGFTTACTFHIDGIAYQKLESPTKVQVLIVGSESLVDREVAYYNLTEKEMLQFNNELNLFDRRFLFYDIVVDNDDIIILNSQQYAVYKVLYNITYGTSSVYGKALRKN